MRKYVINFSSKFVVSVISQAILFFTIPYAARKLGAEKFGEFNLVATLTEFVGYIVIFGFPKYADREISRVNDVKFLVNPLLTLRLVLSFFALFIMFGIGYWVNKSSDFIWLALIVGFTIIINTFDMRWVFIGRDEMWRISYLGLIGQIIFAVLIVLFVDSPTKVIIYSICQLISLAVPIILSFLMYQKYFGKVNLTFSYNKWKELRKESIPLGFSSITGEINAYFVGLLIGLYLTTTDLGYYSAGFKLMMIFNAVFKLMKTIVIPTISRLYVQDRNKLLKFMQMYFLVCLLEGIGSALFLFFFSDWIILTLFGLEYQSAISLLKIWAVVLLPLTPIAMFFAVSLIPCNASKEYLITSIVGSIVTLISIPIFLHLGGVKGAPFSHCVMELSVTLMGAYYFVKKLNINKSELGSLLNIKEAIVSFYLVLKFRSGYKFV
jgi:PST family polysaccharide transporter